MTTQIKQKLEIAENWEKVRKYFHYPALNEPEIADKIKGGARFDFSSGDIRVGESFVYEVSDKSGLPLEEVIEGILIHEVGHYMVFPRNLATIILSGKMLNDFFNDKKSKQENQERQNFIFQTYADIADDTASVLDGNKRDSILNMRTASQETMPDAVNKNIREIILTYLHRQTGKKYELNQELNGYLERMLQIEFLDSETNRHPKDPNKLRLGLFQWGDIVNEMINRYGKGSVGNILSDLDIDSILEQMSPGDIRKALREISGEISRGEYKGVRKWLNDKLKDMGIDFPDEYEGREITIGTSSGELKIDREVVNYYKELSKKYPLVASKKPIATEKTKKSFEETEKWRIGNDSLLAMPHLSGGLFLPGITRQIRIKKRQIKTTEYDLPHLLVAIDSSGSMPNPSDRKSYAVLAGVCAARSYHIHDSVVGVVNFSGDSFYLHYTRNLEDILSAICAYQSGGTKVDLDILKKMLSPEEFKLYEENPEYHIRGLPKEAIKKEVELSHKTFKKALESGSIDLLMFTDGGISNLGEVLEFFEDNKTLNRGTIVLTDHYEQFIPEGEHPNVNIYRVDKEEDIPGIVLKDVRKNMNYPATNYETGLQI